MPSQAGPAPSRRRALDERSPPRREKGGDDAERGEDRADPERRREAVDERLRCPPWWVKTRRGGRPRRPRRAPARCLQELRHQEQRAEEPGVHEEAHPVGGREAAAAEEAEREHRASARRSQPMNANRSADPTASAATTSVLPQPILVARTRPQ